VHDDIVERLGCALVSHGSAEQSCGECAYCLAAAEIERLRAVLDAVDAQVAAYMNGSIGSSQAIQTISRLLDPEEARRG
jgi:hypothetical protein